MDRLFGKTFDVLTSFLGFRSERHQVILSNLVNIDTPDYRPRELVFKRELKGAMDGVKMDLTTTHPGHILPGSWPGKQDLEVVDSGEQVNMDDEMMNLAENHLMYNMTVELLARKFKSLKSVIQEVK